MAKDITWFENEVTGQRWAVSHPDLIADLSKKAGYKQIADPTNHRTEPKPKRVRKT